jgi:hypothetical protein
MTACRDNYIHLHKIVVNESIKNVVNQNKRMQL